MVRQHKICKSLIQLMIFCTLAVGCGRGESEDGMGLNANRGADGGCASKISMSIGITNFPANVAATDFRVYATDPAGKNMELIRNSSGNSSIRSATFIGQGTAKTTYKISIGLKNALWFQQQLQYEPYHCSFNLSVDYQTKQGVTGI